MRSNNCFANLFAPNFLACFARQYKIALLFIKGTFVVCGNDSKTPVIRHFILSILQGRITWMVLYNQIFRARIQ